jgi:2-hydroxychromene-2-carboxylate isomerase
MLLGGVFKATGNASPVSVPAKGRWMFQDIARWARHYGVPFGFNPHFPLNTLSLMRGATALLLRQPQAFERYADTVFKAMWVDGCNLGDASVLAATLAAAGLEAEAFAAWVADPAVKAQLIAVTDEAVVGEQMFFGQDRLQFVREALA